MNTCSQSRFALKALVAGLALVSLAARAGDDPVLAGSTDETTQPASGGSLIGEILLRADRVQNLPGRDPVDRLRSKLRVGYRHSGENWEVGLAVKGSQGDDSNRDSVRNNDNELSDDSGLDLAYVRWQATSELGLLLGKAELPLSITPLTWDADLRPVGVSLAYSHPLGDFDRLSAVAGAFATDHLHGDDTRLTALQLGWHHGEGSDNGIEALLGWFDYSRTSDLGAEGLGRTNRRVGTRLISDFRLLDAQLAWRRSDPVLPLEARLDLVHNTGADDQANGARLSVVAGDRNRAGGMEFGFAAQRIQRDAVLAAFNEDDWWFHSFSRGVMPWFGYGFSDHWSVRIAGFFERRDDQDARIVRSLIDVRGRW